VITRTTGYLTLRADPVPSGTEALQTDGYTVLEGVFGPEQWDGRAAVPIVAGAGDVGLFVSDVWHRRLSPAPDDPGRMFLQCHYGRRDLAQRLRTTQEVNHLSAEAIARAGTARQRRLVGLHPPGFYDG
jgi:hypothetical protein